MYRGGSFGRTFRKRRESKVPRFAVSCQSPLRFSLSLLGEQIGLKFRSVESVPLCAGNGPVLDILRGFLECEAKANPTVDAHLFALLRQQMQNSARMRSGFPFLNWKQKWQLWEKKFRKKLSSKAVADSLPEEPEV